jgi:hypothetical protein
MDSALDYVCSISEHRLALYILGGYSAVTLIAMLFVKCCCKLQKTEDPKKNAERFLFAEYMGRFPIFNFLFTGTLMIVASGLSVFTPCLTLKPFEIDKETENYIKSDNGATRDYDKLMAAVADNQANGEWPYRRRLGSSSSATSSDYQQVKGYAVDDALELKVREDEYLNLDTVVSLTRGSNLNNYMDQHAQPYDYDANLPHSVLKSRRLSEPAQKSVNFVYIPPSLPGNMFEQEILEEIKVFEDALYALKDYPLYCRKYSYYSKNVADVHCAPQFSSIISWFYNVDDEGEAHLMSIDDTLKGMAQSGMISFMDVYFSLDHRVSNVTRSSLNFEYLDYDKFNLWLTQKIVPMCHKFNDNSNDVRILYYDGGYLFDWEVDQAVYSDSMFAGLSFLAVFVFIWAHTRSLIISLFGMLGVVSSIPITLWVYSDLIGVDHMSILNFLSIFVIMGIGADDIFVFYGTYVLVYHEHPGIENDVPLRLAMTFRKACAAMLVTSASTVLSFFANLVSSLPVIKEFGLFMGLVVVINFVLVLIYFPTLVIIETNLFRCCCPSKKEKVRVSASVRGSITKSQKKDIFNLSQSKSDAKSKSYLFSVNLTNHIPNRSTYY